MVYARRSPEEIVHLPILNLPIFKQVHGHVMGFHDGWNVFNCEFQCDKHITTQTKQQFNSHTHMNHSLFK